LIARPPSRRGTSVCDDWCAWLPDSKYRLNESCSKELETLYVMLSVALDEAIDLRRKGALAQAFEAARIAGGLCVRFSQSLGLVLNGLQCHAKHFGLVPNAAPLDADNFRGVRGQRTARLTGFLSRVLLSQRSRFVHKAATLQEMVEDLQKDFCEVVENLLTDAYRNEELWEALDQAHYDLNTCLRETIVLLKSFLVVLPEDQLASFESGLQLSRTKTVQPGLSFRHRPFAAVPGK
jgi:hypothetical protein